MRKRPAIRPRKITPPRGSELSGRPSRLPVVRTPSPPAVRLRPRLQLVTDDDAFLAVDRLTELHQAAYSPEAAEPMTARFWEPRPILFAMVAAAAAVVALVTVLLLRAFGPSASPPIAEEPTSTTTLTSGKPVAKPIEPAIPVVDVHSLPAAPPPRAR